MSKPKDIFGDEIKYKHQPDNESDFSSMLETSMMSVSKRVEVGQKIRGEILTIGKDEVFISTGTLNDGVALKAELLDNEGRFPYKVGDSIELYVCKVQGSDIRLSPKPTAKNLAEDLEDAHDMMLPVEGKVIEVVNGGFRVQLKGKLAFCPISQMDSKKIENPEDYIEKKFQFLITKFEGGKNIVVSRRKFLDEERQASEATFLDTVQVGKILKGVVSRLEKFGAFVEIAPSVEGLVHISELKWFRIQDPAEAVQVGQQIEVKVLKIEDERDKLKISLSLKQVDGERNDPWSMVLVKYPIGSMHKGKITRREPYGLFVQLEEGIVGLLPKAKAQERAEFPFDKLKVGDEVTININEIKFDERRLSLGVPQDPDAEAWKSFSPSKAASFGTLADQFTTLFKKN